ncbi:MAG: PAS domain-containing protein [Anaerolineales bacterium]|nr:PAS domain-containing protein [Anaerolineales bacterium]
MKIDKARLAAKVTEEVIAAHGIAYAQVSPDLEILQVSENLGALLGAPPEEILHRPLLEIFWELVGAEPSLARLLSGELPAYRLEYINRSQKDGTERYLNFILLPVDRENPAQGLLLIVEDETELNQLRQRLVQERNELSLLQRQLLRANEDSQRLSQLKSLILSIAAHDMRAPLNAILGYSEWIQAELPEENSEHKRLLSIIISQVRWLDHLITDLLNLDQIERGKLRITPRPCNLGDLIQQIVSALQVLAAFQNQALVFEPPDAPVIVRADPERIEQILYNLLSNAIKYTPQGGRIQVNAWQEAAFGAFCVQDDGPGMSEQEQGQLFQVYFRSEGARYSLARGAGLGMYIVKTLVDAHQGTIEVASQLERGTAVSIRLPLAQQEA